MIAVDRQATSWSRLLFIFSFMLTIQGLFAIVSCLLGIGAQQWAIGDGIGSRTSIHD